MARFETSATLPVAIPDHTTPLAYTEIPFTVSGVGSVDFVELSLYATHAYLTDLEIALVSPTGIARKVSVGWFTEIFNNTVPVNEVVTPSGTGGTLNLNASQHYYEVSALTDWGESTRLFSNNVNLVGSSTNTGSVALQWDDVPRATGYRVYRRIGPSTDPYYNPLFLIYEGPVSAFTDTGAPAGAPGEPSYNGTTYLTGAGSRGSFGTATEDFDRCVFRDDADKGMRVGRLSDTQGALAPVGIVGQYEPDESFAAFAAEAAPNGTWKIRITDLFGGDVGSVHAVSLFINEHAPDTRGLVAKTFDLVDTLPHPFVFNGTFEDLSFAVSGVDWSKVRDMELSAWVDTTSVHDVQLRLRNPAATKELRLHEQDSWGWHGLGSGAAEANRIIWSDQAPWHLWNVNKYLEYYPAGYKSESITGRWKASTGFEAFADLIAGGADGSWNLRVMGTGSTPEAGNAVLKAATLTIFEAGPDAPPPPPPPPDAYEADPPTPLVVGSGVSVGRDFSGVVVSQSAAPEATSDFVSLAAPVYQEFRLPANYKRGERTPALTGVQLRVGVSSLAAKVHVQVEHKPLFGAWTLLGEGDLTSAPVVDDELWLNCFFDRPLSVAGLEEDEFRFKLTNAVDVTGAWYSVPNPLGAPRARAADGTTALTDDGRDYSLCFRVLASVADSGIDFLGNQYRSVAVFDTVANATHTSASDAYWLSGPQPSEFAVVSQYFDVRDGESAAIQDGVLIDPVTPGMYVHAYYSNDGEPGTDDGTWEERIWHPVPRTHHALRRDTFIFPEPIQAKYVKLEYSHLQPRAYPVGGFQKPINYKKHPKWVLDYFLLATEDANRADEDRFVARNVTVNYDAYSLAFTYYKDDLGSAVAPPPFLTPDDRAGVERFLSARDDRSDVVDATTQAQINAVLQPYLYDVRTRTTARSLLGDVLLLDTSGTSYPVETIASPNPVSAAVSTLDRDNVVFEQSFPVMHFYVPCRHRYREVSAELTHERAYFAGVREVAFTRERYHVESDTAVYTETLGDHFNSERNDFVGVAASVTTPINPLHPPPPEPTASFTRPVTSGTVNVDASASTGTALTYAWTFGDGGTGTGVTAAHTYAASGTYPITLVVTDFLGRTATATANVTVTVVTFLPGVLFGSRTSGSYYALTRADDISVDTGTVMTTDLIRPTMQNTNPTLSADGTKMCFIEAEAFTGSTNYDFIKTADASGRNILNRLQLARSNAADGIAMVDFAVISPDGTKAVLALRINLIADPFMATDQTGGLGILDLASGVLTRIWTNTVGGATVVLSPQAWKSDGSQIAFVTGPFGSRTIEKINVNGTGRTTLSTDQAFYVSWAPNNSKIAYGTGTGTTKTLKTINPDGTGVFTIGTMSGNGGPQLVWSPDSTRLLVRTVGARIYKVSDWTFNAITIPALDNISWTPETPNVTGPGPQPAATLFRGTFSPDPITDDYLISQGGSIYRYKSTSGSLPIQTGQSFAEGVGRLYYIDIVTGGNLKIEGYCFDGSVVPVWRLFANSNHTTPVANVTGNLMTAAVTPGRYWLMVGRSTTGQTGTINPQWTGEPTGYTGPGP